MDGHALSFSQEFDAVFSNAALHWMLRPDDVLAGVRRALRPGGRLVAELGGHGNVASITVALLAVLRRFDNCRSIESPWYFPTAEEYAGKLRQHGFVVDQIMLVPRPTPLPTGMEGWLKTFARPFFGGLAITEQEAARAEVIALLRSVLCDASGHWIADYVRLRVAAKLV
jgi:SAM-dependent methyltransferase